MGKISEKRAGDYFGGPETYHSRLRELVMTSLCQMTCGQVLNLEADLRQSGDLVGGLKDGLMILALDKERREHYLTQDNTETLTEVLKIKLPLNDFFLSEEDLKYWNRRIRLNLGVPDGINFSLSANDIKFHIVLLSLEEFDDYARKINEKQVVKM